MQTIRARMFLADYYVNGQWRHNAHILYEVNMNASDELIIRELERRETEESRTEVKCAIAAELLCDPMDYNELVDIQEGRKPFDKKYRVIIPDIALFMEYMKTPPESQVFQ